MSLTAPPNCLCKAFRSGPPPASATLPAATTTSSSPSAAHFLQGGIIRKDRLRQQLPPPQRQQPVPRRYLWSRGGSGGSGGSSIRSAPARLSSLSLSSASSEASPTRHDAPSDILNGGTAELDDADDLHAQQQQQELQWSLLRKHHVGSWNGVWTTINDMADVMDETVARTILEEVAMDDQDDGSNVVVRHAHVIPVASTKSHCDTCFDDPSVETRTLEVASYQPHTLLPKSKIRLASSGIVVGPKVLTTSGSMALEVGLRFDNSRVRAMIVMAPAWEPNVEPMSCPPHALRVARITLHREVLASGAESDDYFPTPHAEEAQWEAAAQQLQRQGNDNKDDSLPSTTTTTTTTTMVRFHKGVPPFAWHRNWHGTSWTWGPQSGDRGWQLDQVELEDQWHGNNPVEKWNWRSKSVYVQLPKLVSSDETALFRMAWLADPDHLLRIEAGVLALQPVFDDTGDVLVGLEPPMLVSLRCDTLLSDGDESESP